MIRLSRHFTLDEFTISQTGTRLGIDNEPTEYVIANLRRLASMLEEVRLLVKTKVVISSGYRCHELNMAIGGAKNSAHIDGRAADIIVPGLQVAEVADMIANSGLAFDSIIDEFGRWLHFQIHEIGKQPRKQTLRARTIGGRVCYLNGLRDDVKPV